LQAAGNAATLAHARTPAQRGESGRESGSFSVAAPPGNVAVVGVFLIAFPHSPPAEKYIINQNSALPNIHDLLFIYVRQLITDSFRFHFHSISE